jgi:NAD(P)-dependent dehydrogenase (short-subunit alcohol dehydrogenase family)
MDLTGASALVTGAGRGIGRAIAVALGGGGASVTLVSRTKADLEATAREVRAAGGRAAIQAGDLRRRADCDAAVAAAVSAHGGLQVLVNNAGIGSHAPVAETGDDLWNDVLETNLGAVFRVTRAALPHLTRRGGHVFMISSLAGQNAIAGMAAYCASKAALDHFAACLMLEVRHQGVKVTTIAPGSVDTSFGRDPGKARGEGWMLTAQDVAGAVVDLLGTRDGAHLSRVEMRPLRPPKRA